MKASSRLSEAVAVTLELTGTTLSEVAARMMADDLARYPEQQVMGALTRCRRELKGRLTIADVITRLDDGRPGVEEAWAMLPKTESDTAVWTEEMAKASAVTHDLIDRGDDVGARMAFKESYQRLCQSARDRGIPVSWSVTLGWDQQGRESVIRAAVEKGLLTENQVKVFLPGFHSNQPLLQNFSSEIAAHILDGFAK